MPKTKTCRSCSASKEATLKHWRSNGRGGFKPDCKNCLSSLGHFERPKASDREIPFQEYEADLNEGEAEEFAEELTETLKKTKKYLGFVKPGFETGFEPDEQERLLGKVPKFVETKKVFVPGKKPYMIVIFNDVHVPVHDLKVWKTALKFLKDTQPDELILNGDYGELDSCSQHGGNVEITPLSKDLEAIRGTLEEIREVIPDSKITYLEGNHETRLTRFLTSRAPSIVSSLTLPECLHLNELNIEWVPETAQPIRRGKLTILHGHQMNSLPKYHAGRIIELYGEANHKVVFGHSHRAQVVSTPGAGGNKWGIAFGTMRTLDPKWLHGANSGWSHQMGVVYIDSDGSPDVYPVTFRDGGFIWNGQKYG